MTAQPSFRGNDAGLPVAGAGARVRPRGLIALTDDQSLIRALQDLAAGGVDVSVVPDLQSFTDEMLQHAGSVALIDATTLNAPVGEVVDFIRRQLPDMCLMVAGHSTEQQQLASRISDQTVFRFLHKPASTQRLKLFLDAAARPAERSITAAPAPVASRSKVARATRARSGRPARRALGIGIMLIGIAMAAWALWPEGKPVTGKPQAPSPVTQAVTAPPAAALLTQTSNGGIRSIDQPLPIREASLPARQEPGFREAQVRVASTSTDNPQTGALNDPAAGSTVPDIREPEAISTNDVEVAARPAAPEAVAPPSHVEVAAPPAPQPQVMTPAVQPAPAIAPASTPPVSAGSETIPSSKLTLVRSAQAIYPEWALQQLISGWVDLDFTVATDGSVKDIKVTDAQPRNTFNSAATSALARYRYVPVLKDGVPAAQRAHIRLRFAAQEVK